MRWRVRHQFRGSGRKRRPWFYVRQDGTGAIVVGKNGGQAWWPERADAERVRDEMNGAAREPGADPLFEEIADA